MGLSIWHILVVALVIFLLFGAGRVPRMMEDLAKGIKSFKKGLADDDAAPRQVEDKQKDQ
jgi:sec-independent protein translocase protein TatA